MADDNPYLLRAEFERALRHLNLADLDVRELLLKLAAQVVALTDQLTHRLGPDDDATSFGDAVDKAMDEALSPIRAADDGCSRVAIDTGGDKYAAEAIDIPCAELIPLCEGRCCSFSFALSTQDLDEGVIRFDYGKPYEIRQRSSDGYCVHNDPTTRTCEAFAQRPRTCRTYDCRNDKRVWIDYDKRIPAPRERAHLDGDPIKIDRYERARLRGLAVWREQKAIDSTYSDGVSKDKDRSES